MTSGSYGCLLRLCRATRVLRASCHSERCELPTVIRVDYDMRPLDGRSMVFQDMAVVSTDVIVICHASHPYLLLVLSRRTILRAADLEPQACSKGIRMHPRMTCIYREGRWHLSCSIFLCFACVFVCLGTGSASCVRWLLCL